MLNLSSFDSALKELYKGQRVPNLVYKNNPALAWISKMTDFKGRNYRLPLIYGNPQGRSADFERAQNNKGSSQLEDFVLTRVNDYSLADIDGETLEVSEGDSGAFIRAVTTEIDGALQSATRSLAPAMFRSGTGSIGVAASGTGTATITLSNASNIANFEVGQVLVASLADGGTLRTGSPARAAITGVNRSLGTVTFAAALDTLITDIADGDTLYVEGDAANGGANVKISGFEAWIPASAPGSTAFFGVDRTADTTRLGGIRYDGTGETIAEALISGGSLIAREGGRPDVVFMNHVHHGELLNELGSKVQYGRLDVPKVNIGFDTIKVHTAAGIVDVVADHNCPVGVAWMLQSDTWKLYTVGNAPKIIMHDGNRMLRNTDSDSVEVRTGYRGQMGCSAPGWNGRIALATS